MADDFVTEIKGVVADPTAGPTLNDLLNAEAGRLVEAPGGDEFDPMGSSLESEILDP